MNIILGDVKEGRVLYQFSSMSKEQDYYFFKIMATLFILKNIKKIPLRTNG